MANSIRFLEDKNNNIVLPVTHLRGVFNNDGDNLEEILEANRVVVVNSRTQGGIDAAWSAEQGKLLALQVDGLASLIVELEYEDGFFVVDESGYVAFSVTEDGVRGINMGSEINIENY